MEARSYVENIANRTATRAAAETMSRLLMVVLIALGIVPSIVSNFHPFAVMMGLVTLGLAAVLARDVVRLRRQRREYPLDLAFEPAPTGGLLSPGVIFGAALAVALFAVVLSVVVTLGRAPQFLTWSFGGLVLAAAIALVGVPTLRLRGTTWHTLAKVLAAHPEQVAVLQDARARFPADAPFPFSAPTDQVTIP